MSRSSINFSTRSEVAKLDESDFLAEFRKDFYFSDPSVCYLDGNSLGRLPLATIDVVNDYLLNEWGKQLVAGWNSWIDEAQRVGDVIGRAALGVKEGQMLAVDTTSVNFYQLCHAACSAGSGRKTVISDTANFPTDRYILEGICNQLGLKLVLINDETGEECITPSMLEPYLDENVALVTFSVIQYRSGALHDVKNISKMARDVGAFHVWDASHAVGVVPLELDHDQAGLAVGCTYKYGNSGPGAPAWMYISESLQQQLGVPIQGWFAQDDQFAMAQEFDRSPTIRGFQIASPSIIGLRCVETAFNMIERAGMTAIAQKAAIGTDLMIALHDEWLAPLGCSVVTPRDSGRRGGHITIRHPEARRISLALREFANVVVDYRQPDCIRLAISPLATSYLEVWDGFQRLREVIATKKYESVTESSSRVT
ncbi:MAG: kynureninase [Actinomycetes bacterium]